MERAEEVGASEGLNDLCVQKSGSSPTATQTGKKPARDVCFLCIHIKVFVLVFPRQ